MSRDCATVVHSGELVWDLAKMWCHVIERLASERRDDVSVVLKIFASVIVLCFCM